MKSEEQTHFMDAYSISQRERGSLERKLEETYIKYLDNFLDEYGKAYKESSDTFAKPDVVLTRMEIPDHYLAVWAKHLMMIILSKKG